METDAFFCQLLTCMPGTLFELLGMPASVADEYHFDAVEMKKSFRADGRYLPLTPGRPAYIVEFQFQRQANFYANLFSKVFVLLNDNPWITDWVAVAVFECRAIEPESLEPYEDLLRSKRVRRIYLDEHVMPANASPGLGLLQLVTAPDTEMRPLVEKIKVQAAEATRDSDAARKVIELLEELLIRRYATMNREEIRKMFRLTDIRKTAVWKEARAEGIEEGRHEGIEEGFIKGIEKGKLDGAESARLELVRQWLATGMSAKQISELLAVPLKNARALMKKASPKH